jgi:hypothetical protein
MHAGLHLPAAAPEAAGGAEGGSPLLPESGQGGRTGAPGHVSPLQNTRLAETGLQ